MSTVSVDPCLLSVNLTLKRSRGMRAYVRAIGRWCVCVLVCLRLVS